MRYSFSKMQSLGNDFVVLDGVNENLDLNPERVRRLSDRHYGVGCDQLLVVEPSALDDCDFRYVIYNQDGSQAEQCGNGARCFALFLQRTGLSTQQRIPLQTSNRHMLLEQRSDGLVTVHLQAPVFNPAAIPLIADQQQASYQLDAGGESITLGALSVGNPHGVILVENVDNARVNEIGPLIESHARFPQRTNVGFMQVVNRDAIRLRVYERAVGETIGCGSGACAAACYGISQGLLNQQVKVALPGGELDISWQGGANDPILMTGPATHVFDGEIEIA